MFNHFNTKLALKFLCSYSLQMIPQKKESPMRITAGSLDVVVPCESRNVTSLEGIDLLLDFSDSLFSVPSAQNLCGEQVFNLQLIKF